MAKSQRTKDCVKRRNIFWIISMLLWTLTATFHVFAAFRYGIIKMNGSLDKSNPIILYITSIATTLLIAIVLTILIKDKVRNTVWMASVLLSAIVYGESGMYITFALWALDEWIIHALYNNYKNKVVINKEIDLRE